MKTLLLTAGLAVFALSGCASISEDQCLAGNWAERGFKDGAKGKSRTVLSDYIDTCAKYGAEPNNAAYLDNYEQGLISYCTYERGFSRGENGSSYNQVCSGPLAQDFAPGYDAGRIVYEIQQEHDELVGRYEDTVAALTDVRYRLEHEDLSDDERKRLRKKAIRLRSRKEDLRDAIFALERRHEFSCHRF